MPVSLAAFVALLSGISSDPLFQRMEGDWIGEGERIFATSGRHVPIHAEVHSEVIEDRLISKNNVTEGPRTYVRVYWLRAKLNQPGQYELGYGDGSSAPAMADGQFGENKLEVDQVVGSGLVIHSQTQFTAEGTLTIETGIMGKESVFETKIQYHRSSGGG